MDVNGKHNTGSTGAGMEKKGFSLCVFCGSRAGDDPQYLQAAESMGRWIGGYGHNLVYGGGSTGMMGALSAATLESGGTVTGIIPAALMEHEVARKDCTELLVTADMHQRKALMLQKADAIITLPGGIGTFEELFEFWTLAQLGYHNKPMALANVGGYFDDFIVLLEQVQERGFVSSQALNLMLVGYSVISLGEDLYREHHERLGTGLRPVETGVWAEGDRFDHTAPADTGEPKVCPFSGKPAAAAGASGQAAGAAVTPASSAEPVPPPQCPAHKS